MTTRLAPIPMHLRLTRQRKKSIKGGVVKTPKSVEVKYRKTLRKFIRTMRADVDATILPILKTFEQEYVNDAYAEVLERAFEDLVERYTTSNAVAKIVSNAFVEGANNVNKQRFYGAMTKATGVNLSSIIQNEGLNDILVASTRENVALIRSIPAEYFKQIETLVFTETTQGASATSMIKQIQKIGRTTEKRAKLIARDQTSKLNSVLNQQRQQNLGVEEYIWRTARDGRVRDTHDAHKGKIFRWDDPPKDTGHPGKEINCRCIAQPIIKL